MEGKALLAQRQKFIHGVMMVGNGGRYLGGLGGWLSDSQRPRKSQAIPVQIAKDHRLDMNIHVVSVICESAVEGGDGSGKYGPTYIYLQYKLRSPTIYMGMLCCQLAFSF